MNRCVIVEYPDVWVRRCTVFLKTVLRNLRFKSVLTEILLKTDRAKKC